MQLSRETLHGNGIDMNSRVTRMGSAARTFCALAGFLTLMLATGLPLVAQNVSTTGQIRGRVAEEAGGPVQDAVVTARNVDTGFERTAITGDGGVYVLRLLPPGTYHVSTDVIGFQADTIRNVRVAIGQTSSANFTLSTRAVGIEGIEVRADRQRIDVTDASVVQLVTRQQIEELPSLGRDFTDFVELSGLVAPDPGQTTGGQFAIAGMRPSGTNVMIDGVDANNSFFGENRGGARIPFVFSLESIEEFQIVTNGFDVEYGNYSGGIVNVVTRGGGNELEGTVYGNYRSDALTAGHFIDDPSNPELIDEYEVQQFAGRVSGPIITDRAFFLVSADAQRRREPQLPLTRARFSPGGERDDPAAYAGLQEFFDILENQYGISNAAAGYSPFQTTNDALTLFGRVDWTLNPAHRLSVRHNFSTFTNDNEWNGIFDFDYGLSRAEEFSDRSHSFVTELQSVFGPNTFNVFRFQWADEKRPRQGKDLRPTLTVSNVGGGQRARYGGTFAAFNNTLEESKLQFIDNFTHVVGSHTLKIGANALFTNILNQFQNPGSQNQGAGEYVFASLDDLRAFRPASYYRPMQLGGGISRAEFQVSEWGVYLQDEWTVTPRLTATAGLRYDRQSFGDEPLRVIDVERAFGWETGVAPTDDDNISPRLSLAYDMDGTGEQVLRAGVGYFYGRVPYVLGGNVLQTELPSVEVVCRGSLLEGDPDAPPSPAGYGSWGISGFDNPSGCAGEVGAGGVPSYSFWTSDFEFPETLKANLGYEGLLGDRTRLSVDLLFAESSKEFSVRNLNLRDAQFQLADEGGRRVYTPAAAFDPSQGNAPAAWRNTDFGGVYANYNDGRSRSFNLNTELSHNFGERLNVGASYTFSRAYDNISRSCCTSSSLHADPTVGVYGPNDLGGVGEFDKAWGRSDYNRDHTVIFSGFARGLPLGIELSGFWRLQSGRPWTPEVRGDLNGDGVRFNDRPFVFAPEALPLPASVANPDSVRGAYAAILAANQCVGDYVGQVVERNTCRFPWSNRLDLRVTRRWNTFPGQRAELQADLFNVLNGVGRLFCDSDTDDPTSGPCGWGRVTGVFGSDRNLLEVAGFDPENQQILYRPGRTFGQEDVLGANLLLQFQAQLGFKYYF